MDGEKKLKYLCILGGGANRGLSYIGAKKALDECRVEPCGFAGSSVGAVFATLFAFDYKVEELKEIFNKVNSKLFKDLNLSLKPTVAISKGEVFYNFIKNCIGKKFYGENYSQYRSQPLRFCDIEKDLFIITTDLTNSKPKLFSKYTTPEYEIAKAVRISAAMPGLMTPIEYENNVLIDGDLIKSWPLWLVDNRLNPDDIRILEFRLEGGKKHNQFKKPIDFINSIISCLSNYATDHILELYEQKDKYDYIVIDTKDLILTDFDIDQKCKDSLYELGYTTTKNYFENTLKKKKIELIKIYANLLDNLIKVKNMIYDKKYLNAKCKLSELFYDLCDTKHIIDTMFYKKIRKLYENLEKNLIKSFFFSRDKIKNKEEILLKLRCLICELEEKIEDLNNYFEIIK